MTFSIRIRTRLNFIFTLKSIFTNLQLYYREYLTSWTPLTCLADHGCQIWMKNWPRLKEKLITWRQKFQEVVKPQLDLRIIFVPSSSSTSKIIVPTKSLYEIWDQRSSFQARPRLVIFVPGTSCLYDKYRYKY